MTTNLFLLVCQNSLSSRTFDINRKIFQWKIGKAKRRVSGFLAVKCILYSCILYFELRPPKFYASSYEHYTTLTKKTTVTMWFKNQSTLIRHTHILTSNL